MYCFLRPLAGVVWSGRGSASFFMRCTAPAMLLVIALLRITKGDRAVPGTMELLILASVPLVGLLLIISAIFRLRKKLSLSEKPTLGAYVNELGGYALIGVILLVGGLVFAASKLGTSPPADEQQSKTPQPRIQTEGVGRHESGKAEAPLVPDGQIEKDRPSAVLNRLAGHWDIVAEQNGEATVVAKVIASQLEKSPWVVRQMFDLEGVLHGIQVTGFDADRSQYHYYRVGLGSAASHFAGTWDADDRSFTWVKHPSGDDGEIMRERVEDARIEATHEIIEDEVVQRSSTFELRRTKPPLEYNWGSPLYKKYEGTWSTDTKVTADEESRETKGRVIFARLPNTNQLVALYFNSPSGNLADIQLVYFDGDEKPLRRRWITNAGDPIELKGTLNEDKQSIVWTGPAGAGDTLELTDDFSGNAQFESRIRLVSEAGEAQPIATTELHRIEQ